MNKKVIFTFIFVVLVTACISIYGKSAYEYVNNWISASYCDRTIKYDIGTIDKEFDINKEDFAIAVEQSAALWSNIMGKNLFKEDANGKLTINMVYDGRQKIVNKINDIGEDVQESRQQFEDKNKLFESRQKQIEQDSEQLNKDILYWNARGGAPEKIYRELERRQTEIKARIHQFNKEAIAINQEVLDINKSVESLNTNIETLNSSLKDKPEMGIYTPGKNEIDIYFYSSPNDLKHVIAHELGHALGLKHIEVKDAIMNPTSSENIIPTKEDIEEITNYCKTKTRVDLIRNDIYDILYILNAKLEQLQVTY